MASCPTVAILGNGGAAAECVKALRSSGHAGAIHIFSDNDLPPYNPMLTTYYAAGRINYDQLFPYGSADQFYRHYRVQTFLNSPVTAVDFANRTVLNAAGTRIAYDKCLIATGATPILPSIPGIQSSRVFPMRTVRDAASLKRSMQLRPKRAVVVGASMVGIKLVELFANAGMEVCLADLADHVFPTAAHPDCATVLERRLEAKGIRLRLGAAISAIEEGSSGIRAYFKDSSEAEEADLVAMCIGVKANVGFLDKTKIAIRQGIVIDEFMRTSVEGVYAAGDVAQGKNLLTGNPQIIGLWANARYQGRTAGCHMAGNPLPYPGDVPSNITHFMGMTFAGIGDVSNPDSDTKMIAGENYAQFFYKQKRLVGANLIDCDLPAGMIRHKLIRECLLGRITDNEMLALFGSSAARERIFWAAMQTQ